MSADRTIHLLTHEFSPVKGGSATYCREMALAATRLGFSVKVWAPALTPGKNTAERNAMPFPVVPIPVRGKQGLPDRFRLALAVKRHLIPRLSERDILHLAEAGPLTTALTFPRLFSQLQRKLLITIHGSEILKYAGHPLLKSRFTSLLQSADRIHVLSNNNKNLLHNRVQGLENKIILAPGGPRTLPPPPESFPFPMGNREYLEILTVGRLHPRKGQSRLLEYLASIPEAVKPSIRLWMVGPIHKAAYFRRCAKLARQSGLDVRFIHGCPDSRLQEFYRRADIFVLTSIDQPRSLEGFGLVNVEAASYGIPVIAHDTGGIRDTVLHGKTGFLFPPGRTDLFHDALLHLIEDSVERTRMGTHATRFSRSMSWENAAKKLYGVYFQQ